MPRIGSVTRFAPLAMLTAFVALFGLVRAKRSDAFDLAFTLKLQGAQRPWLRRTMTVVSWPGFPPQSRIIPPIVIAAWAVSGRPRAAAYLTVAWGGAALSTVLKSIVRRPRPLPPAVNVVVASLGGTSFPSGHVLTYVMFYGFLAHLLVVHGRPGMVPRATGGALLSLIALIGPSRV